MLLTLELVIFWIFVVGFTYFTWNKVNNLICGFIIFVAGAVLATATDQATTDTALGILILIFAFNAIIIMIDGLSGNIGTKRGFEGFR